MSVEVDLPDAFMLVSGNTSWFGDIPVWDEVIVISATVKSVKSGNWTIRSTTNLNPKENGGFGGTGEYLIYVSVSEDAAEWGIYPPWDYAPVSDGGINVIDGVPVVPTPPPGSSSSNESPAVDIPQPPSLPIK
jgi:hypothetical protein